MLYSALEDVKKTKCVERLHEWTTLSCSWEVEMIAIRSVYYARLSVNISGFCQRPWPDDRRGDCVRQNARDRDSLADDCNKRSSCYVHLYRRDVDRSCSNVTGHIYVNINYDCILRESAL